MPFEVFMGLRYLRAHGQRTNLSLFVWIGVGGVFLGVAALIVVLATMTGFQEGIRDRIIAANPHLLVYHPGRPSLADTGRVAARIGEIPGVRSATPFVHQQALFTRPGGGAHGGLIRGIDLQAPAVLKDVQGQLRSGSVRSVADGEAGILLGRELSRTLGVTVGDEVTVISPEGALTAVGMVPRMRRYTVAGTFELGMYELDASLAYLSLPAAREFAGQEGASGIEVKLKDPFDAKRVGRAVGAALGYPYWVRDWMDMNRSLFAALQLEKLALFVIVTIIVLVAAFAIIGHLVLLVAEKRKEIGVLKALGASSRSITVVFFTVGMTIGVAGTLAGSALGLGLIWAQNTYKIIRLASDVYQISYLPMKLTVGDGLMVIGATLFLSFLATIIPARRAGALEPVDVLRYE
jgi:lipoprotein-releasing system permease protein